MKANTINYSNSAHPDSIATERDCPQPRSSPGAGLLAALCILCASSALAQFYDVQRNVWTGEHDHFCGNTLINSSTTLNNAGSLIYTNSTFPTNTGPLSYTGQWTSGDYWWAIGVLDDGSDGAIINNTGTIQGIISGNGTAQAVGIASLQTLTITNSGTIDGEVLNNDGYAQGVWTDAGNAGNTIINNGIISARSKFSTVAVNTQNRVYLVNNGTIQSIADAGTQGISANQAYADCIGVGSGVGIPMYFENNGQLIAMTTSTTATNQARVFPCWANGPVTFKNTGFIYCASLSSKGQSQGFYYGVQSYDIWLYNNGTITNAVPANGGGYALWFENDGDRGDIGFCNSGTITSPNTGIVLLAGHWGPPSVSRLNWTNTGTISGAQIRLYGWPASIYESGQVHTTLYGLNDYSDVHIMGLPTLDSSIGCSGGNTTPLEFNLVGTLQKVNGNTASGTNLSAFNLAPSGSIVVSGKTYSWTGARSVSGFVNPGGSVPPPWQQQDIGSVGVAGGAVYCGAMFTSLASGTDLWSTSDAFHYVYQTASNNCTIIARVSLPQTSNPNGKAGVMIRDSLNANAANAFIGLTATNTLSFLYRSSDGGNASSNWAGVVSTTYWVKLEQSGSTLTGYYSVDGVNWTQLGSTTLSMGTTGFMGLAFCNNNNSSLGTATFYNVSCAGGLLAPSVPAGLTATAGVEQVTLNWQAASNTASYNIGRSTVNGGPYTTVGSTSGTNYTDRNLAGRTTYYYVVTAVTPGGQSGNSAQGNATPSANVPAPWVAQDIGPVGAVGSESYTNGVFTVNGAGADIDNAESFDVGTQDTFRFVYATNSGNCTVIARVASVQNVDAESKAGVMIRDSLDPAAVHAFVGMTPGKGVYFTYRSTYGAIGTVGNNVTNLVAPCWVALVRSGSTFSGYYSLDGNNWTLLGTTTLSMAGTDYVGMAVSSRNNWGLCTATFDNVSVPGWPSVAGPTGLTATAGANGQVNLTWNALTNATSYNIKRSLYSGGPYTTIATGVATTNYTDLGAYAIANCYYVVSAMVAGSETANSAEAVVHHPKLTGTIIGTAGSWGNSGNTIAKVFDGNLSTYFDGPDATGDWVGLHFGASVSNAITLINYCPRSSYEGRTVGGIFQGANQSDFSDAVALCTVTAQPPSSVFTSVSITNTSAFRYVRYLSPTNGYCNVAELEFYGYLAGASVPPPAAPGGLAAAAVSASQINLTWNAVTNAAAYNVKRSATNGGPYVVIATGVIGISFTDSGLTGSTTYFYVVSGVNAGGEGANSAQASATTPVAGLFWSGAVNSTWDTATANWRTNGVSATFSDGITVAFDNTASGNTTVNLSATRTPGSVVVSNSTLTYSIGGSAIAGPGSLTKSGSGALTLTSANTYSGGTTLNGGTLTLATGGGSGAIRGALTINSGATVSATANDALGYNSGANVTNIYINGGTFNIAGGGNNGFLTSVTFTNGGTLSASGSGNNFTVHGGAGYSGVNSFATLASATTATISAPVRLTDNSTVGFNIAAGTAVPDLLISGTIVCVNGTIGNITKNGPGTMTLSANNAVNPGIGSSIAYSGITTLNAGQLNLNNAGALGTGAFTIAGGAVDNTSGSPITLSANNAQNWNGDFTFLGSTNLNLGTGAITLNANRVVTVNTNTLTVDGVISGSGLGLTKAGNGMLKLSGANTYSGATAISAGELLISSVSLVNGNYSVVTGATLGVTNGSGSSALVSNLTVAVGAALEFQNVASSVRPLITASNITFNGSGTVKITGTNGLAAGGSYPLMSYTGALSGSLENLQLQMPYGWRGTLANTGNQIVLASVAVVATIPAQIGFGITNGQMQLDWPGDHTGWRLQMSTNLAGANWEDVSAGVSTNQIAIPVISTNATVFYRLIYP